MNEKDHIEALQKRISELESQVEFLQQIIEKQQSDNRETSNDEKAALTGSAKLHNSDHEIIQHPEAYLSEQSSEPHAEIKKKFRLLFEKSPLGIYIANKEGNIIDGNDKLLELLNSPSLEATKQINVLSFPPLVLNGYAKLFTDCVSTGQTQHIELLYTSKWGKQVYLSSYLVPLLDSMGKVEHVYTLMEDITPRKETEANLRLSEQKHRDFINHAPNIFYRFSSKRGALYWSDKVETVLGYSPEELNDNPFLWINSIHPDFKEPVNKAIEDYNKGGEYSIEYKIRTKDGRWIWLHDYFMYKKVLDDEVIIDGHATEITPRKNLELALLDSKQRFELAMQATQDGLWDWNPIKNEIYFSHNWKAMLGYADAEIKNDFSVWRTYIHPDDFEQSKESFQRLIGGETKKLDTEFRMRHKDGHWVEILSRAFAVFNAEGKPIRVVGTHVNISDRKALKRALADSELRWKFAVEGSNDGMWDWNMETDEVFYSEQYRNMLGYSASELEPSFQAWQQILHPEDRALVTEALGGYLNGESENFSARCRLRCKDDSYKWVLTRGKIIDHKDGAAVRMLGIHTDIDQLVENENLLRELNATKDKFFSIIAHDLRSPFSAILGFSELAIRQLSKNSYTDIPRFCNLINDSARHSYNLLENLLEWSRLQTNRIQCRLENLELYSIVKGVSQFFAGNLQSKHLELRLNIPQNLTALGDEYMVEAVMRNLVSNAIKYSFPHGKIEISAYEQLNSVIVSVADNGTGISSEQLKKIFRIESGRSTPGTQHEKGSGLGLVLCKEFVEKQGGRIWVDSSLERGSIFSFSMRGSKLQSGEETVNA